MAKLTVINACCGTRLRRDGCAGPLVMANEDDTPCCCRCALGVGILICNSNAITDDDFDVSLNGTSIGVHRAADNSIRGEFWSTDSSIDKNTVCQSPFTPAPDYYGQGVCACMNAGGVVKQSVDKELFDFKGTNTLSMYNTKDNGSGNYGIVRVFLFCIEDGQVKAFSEPLVSTYGAGFGGTSNFVFSLDVDISENCSCGSARS